MKKYRIIDEDGEKYEVEELEMTEKDETPCHDEDEDVVLTVEEIVKLKQLIPHIEKLLATVETTDEEGTPDEEEEEEEEEIVTDEEEKEEEVVETEKVEKKTRDSKSSFGAIEKKKTVVDDSLTDDIAEAWNKRYGGK